MSLHEDEINVITQISTNHSKILKTYHSSMLWLIGFYALFGL